ncbi:MAG: hypothetical protein QOD77_669 [Thermoplasmata archaeon]|jgi:hypothetical protein|nr:hypothetical protein [Thermoplasmata archaeon]
MDAARAALFRHHAACCNGQDTAALAGHYPASSRVVRDGEWVGEGPDSVLAALGREFAGGLGRVLMVEGEPMLVQWSDPERLQVPYAVVRLKAQGDRVSEVRIDHDPAFVRDVVARGTF